MQSRVFDVVLTDLSLPDGSALDAVRRLRQQDRSIPIVVLTDLDDDQVESSALAAGAQEYLLKGEITPHALERAVFHAIQRQLNIVEREQLLEEVRTSRETMREQTALLERN